MNFLNVIDLLEQNLLILDSLRPNLEKCFAIIEQLTASLPSQPAEQTLAKHFDKHGLLSGCLLRRP